MLDNSASGLRNYTLKGGISNDKKIIIYPSRECAVIFARIHIFRGYETIMPLQRAGDARTSFGVFSRPDRE
jgi:hypothetical protein